MDKAALRRKMRQLRHDQPRELAIERSGRAQEFILSSSLWQKARTVALYMPTQGEIGTERLFQDALARGKELYLPRVVPGSRGTMFFVRVSGREDLVPGAYGILEPKPSLKGLGKADFRPDFAVVPGGAFDWSGHRLGFGGGYYDRFFAGKSGKNCVLTGLCFDFQTVGEVPAAAWDVLMTQGCTETRFSACRQDRVPAGSLL